MLSVMWPALGSLVDGAWGFDAKAVDARASWCGKLFSAVAISAANGDPTAWRRLRRSGRMPRDQMLYILAG